MGARKKAVMRAPAREPRVRPPGDDWKLEDAKARFSEVVRRARSEGPQRVSVRGKVAVVIIAAEELERLLAPPALTPLVAFLETLNVECLDLAREPDFGWNIVL